MTKWIYLITLFLLFGCESATIADKKEELKQNLIDKAYESVIVRAKDILQQAQTEKNSAEKLEAYGYLASAYYHLGDYHNAARFFDQIIYTSKAPYNLPSEFNAYQAITSFYLINDYSGFKPFVHFSPLLFSEEEHNFIMQLVELPNLEKKQKKLALNKLRDTQCQECQPLLKGIQANFQGLRTSSILHALYKKNDDEVLGYFYAVNQLASKRFQNVVSILEPYTQTRFKHLEAKLMLANAFYELNKYEKAELLIQNLKVLTTNSASVLQLSGLLAYKRGDFENAKNDADRSIDLGLQSPTNQIVAGLASLHLKQKEQAIRYLKKLAVNLEREHPLNILLTQLEYSEYQDFNKLETQAFDELSDDYIQDETLINNETKTAKNQVTSENVKPTLYKISAKKSEFKRYYIELNDALKSNDIGMAKNILTGWQQQAPNSVSYYNAAALLASKLGNEEDITYNLVKAKAIKSDNIPSLLWEIEQAKKNKKWTNVISISTPMLFERFIVLQPIIKAWTEAHSKLHTLNFKDVNTLTEIMGAKFEGIFFGHLIVLGEWNTAGEYLYNVVKKENWGKGHWRGAIQLNVEIGRMEQSSQLITEFTQKHSKVTEKDIYFLLGVTQKIADWNNVSNLLALAKKENIKLAQHSYLLTKVLLSQGEFDKALKQISLIQKKGDLYFDLLAEIHYLKKDNSSAKVALISSLELKPTLLKFEKLYELHTKHAKADIELLANLVKTYIDKLSNQTEDRVKLAHWFLNEKPELMVELLDVPSCMSYINKTPVLLNNFAWALMKINQLDRAMTMIDKALDFQPKNNDFLETKSSIANLKLRS